MAFVKLTKELVKTIGSVEIQARMLGHLEKVDPAYAAGVLSAISAKRARWTRR